MRSFAYLLGIVLIIVAVIYFMVPADSLPLFFPGSEAGLMRPRVKHGVASGVLGVIMLVVGWVLSRSK